MKLRLAGEAHEFDLELVSRNDHEIAARIDGRELLAELQPTAAGPLLRIGEDGYLVNGRREGDSILVAVGPNHFRFTVAETNPRRRSRGLTAHEIVAPMPGKVLKILVREGDQVAAGAPLIVLEAMKMETTLAAEVAAVIGKIHAVAGAMVDHGAVLIELKPPVQNPSAPESDPPAH